MRGRNLTDIEREALAAGEVNFTDAHARHTLHERSRARLIESLTKLLGSRTVSYPSIEDSLLDALGRHTGQNYRTDRTFILYSASIALDVIAKQLLPQRRRIGMITPAFDSVPALFSRSGLSLTAVPEERLMPVCDFEYLDRLNLGTLVVVTPNNPTGSRLSHETVDELLGWCAERDVELVLDLSFRMFDPQGCTDLVARGNEVGVRLVTVDDTGKTLPLFDTKVGVLTATDRLAADLASIVSDVLLNVPALDLILLAALLGNDDVDEVARAGEVARTNSRLLTNHQGIVPASASGGDLHPADGFQPSLAWLRIGPHRDRAVLDARAQGLHLLPGDNFFWADSAAANRGADWIRIPLLRDQDYFARGLAILADVLTDLGPLEEAS